jgi:hypothetical protein
MLCGRASGWKRGRAAGVYIMLLPVQRRHQGAVIGRDVEPPAVRVVAVGNVQQPYPLGESVSNVVSRVLMSYRM